MCTFEILCTHMDRRKLPLREEALKNWSLVVKWIFVPRFWTTCTIWYENNSHLYWMGVVGEYRHTIMVWYIWWILTQFVERGECRVWEYRFCLLTQDHGTSSAFWHPFYREKALRWIHLSHTHTHTHIHTHIHTHTHTSKREGPMLNTSRSTCRHRRFHM